MAAATPVINIHVGECGDPEAVAAVVAERMRAAITKAMAEPQTSPEARRDFAVDVIERTTVNVTVDLDDEE